MAVAKIDASRAVLVGTVKSLSDLMNQWCDGAATRSIDLSEATIITVYEPSTARLIEAALTKAGVSVNTIAAAQTIGAAVQTVGRRRR
jgi:hypothetical protein